MHGSSSDFGFRLATTTTFDSMAFRDSIESSDPGTASLLNDTLLDQSDFIDHVSIPPGDSLNSSFQDSNYWRQPLWKRILPSFKPRDRSRRRSLIRNHENESCLQCRRKGFGRRKGIRWCIRLGLGTLLTLYEVVYFFYT